MVSLLSRSSSDFKERSKQCSLDLDQGQSYFKERHGLDNLSGSFPSLLWHLQVIECLNSMQQLVDTAI